LTATPQCANIPPMKKENIIIQADCVELLTQLTSDNNNEGFADLIFADPPFNIGYDYDKYDDKLDHDKYVDWTKKWMTACRDALLPHGSFWIAIGDDYAAEVRVTARQLGLTMRNWIIWYYTFGQQTKKKFARSHTHIFYFVKDAKNFIFNDAPIRVPSARQLIYKDKRADTRGRVPDDTWILRPQDIEGEEEGGFTPDQDTWHISRVCGTFKERAGFHGCQMPEKLLERIILTATNEGHLVVDPFSGSGTTVTVAAQLGRKFLGIDLSENYVELGLKRVERSFSSI
jgi:DNA modification methylase